MAILVMWPGGLDYTVVSSAPEGSIWYLVTIGPVVFDEMVEIVILWESQVKGQTMTITSSTHKSACAN